METILKGCSAAWPELPYAHWHETLKTLHQWTQIIGKIRLQAMPWQNHSWHSTLYLTPRGFSTGSMPYQDGLFEVELDFESHTLKIHSTFHDVRTIALPGQSVASFYQALLAKLAEIKVEVAIHPRPNELEHNTPFAENTFNQSYDQQAVLDYWQASISIFNVFSQFRSGFVGKCSPVHLFWGAFDLAVTRFSGRPAPLHPGGAPHMPLEVMQEAYSQEVSSAGFWPGGDAFPEPIFYSYCYPSPETFGQQAVKPAAAFWQPDLGEFVLKYEAVRQAADPAGTLLDFLETTYEAAANTGNWDRESLEAKR